MGQIINTTHQTLLKHRKLGDHQTLHHHQYLRIRLTRQIHQVNQASSLINYESWAIYAVSFPTLNKNFVLETAYYYTRRRHRDYDFWLIRFCQNFYVNIRFWK